MLFYCFLYVLYIHIYVFFVFFFFCFNMKMKIFESLSRGRCESFLTRAETKHEKNFNIHFRWFISLNYKFYHRKWANWKRNAICHTSSLYPLGLNMSQPAVNSQPGFRRGGVEQNFWGNEFWENRNFKFDNLHYLFLFFVLQILSLSKRKHNRR